MTDPIVQRGIAHAEAMATLDRVCAEPTVIHLVSAYRRFDELAAAIPHAALKMACLSTFTAEPLTPAIRLASLRAGIRTDIWTAPFGQVVPTLIDADKGLGRFAPDVVLVAARLADVVPDLYDGLLNNEAPTAQKVADYLDQLSAGIAAFRQRSQATLLIQDFERPCFLVAGLNETDSAGSQIDIWQSANRRLQDVATVSGNCYVMGYDALVAHHGSASWIDPRTELYGRIPIAAKHYWDYGQFVVRYLRPLAGKTRKVIILDADNTLWGGILGDDGIDGIKLGSDFPGSAFVRFQRRLLALQQRGIILCIASKNEPGSVENVVNSHPEMVLRPDHIACMRVSWSPKPDAVRDIAETLNLSPDSFVFIDDSPVECAMMRETLPEVMTIQLPDDPARYADVIASLEGFDQFTLSEEDKQRGAMYKAEADRKQLASAAVDLPSFYRGLKMRLSIGINDERFVARAAQMTQRTNQFNMHTIRCSEDDIRAQMRAADSEVLTLSLSDRFGDSGVVGLAVVEKSANRWLLHMLLMSCRVLGRTVESAFVAWISKRALDAGAVELRGVFVPTVKNAPFADFYHRCGFEPTTTDTDAVLWVLKLISADTTIPDWFDIEPAPST
ncbi:MAG: HAD-IIIC family phosphatase [Phycisphaerales bacterium]|nr:HAD-IIIC family phosphatase [Phycisphaerales bacterium]MCB9863698.1 HAD-IIIC family phosphatase [Phycisphaerales bacterium]